MELLIELEKSEFSKINSLFSSVPYQSFIIASINIGNTIARVWCNNKDKPTAALVIDSNYCFYLGGTGKDAKFNHSIKKLFENEIFPNALQKEKTTYKISYSCREWEKILENTILEDPIKGKRILYSFSKLLIPDWKQQIPLGFQILPIDENVLSNDSLVHLEDVKDEIKLMWGSEDNFLAKKGFGFCAVDQKNQTIATWLTAEYVSEYSCGIGVETFARYQRKGFATLCACAFVESYLNKRKGMVAYWDASANNQASLKTAEKVGFVKKYEYNVYFGGMSKFWNLFEKATHSLYVLSNFEESVDFFLLAFDIQEPTITGHYHFSRALALVGKKTEAVDQLNMAIDKGFTNLEYLKGDFHLQNLRSSDEWNDLIVRLENILEETDD